MIACYYGDIGAGKTITAVMDAMNYLKKGYYIFANFPLRYAYIMSYKTFCEFPFPFKSLLIIDEAHLWFNSRLWRDTNLEILKKFTQSRKMGYDIILTTQRIESIDVQIREIITFFVKLEDYYYFTVKKYHSDPYFVVSPNRRYNLGMSIIPKFLYKRYYHLYDTRYVVSINSDFPLMDYVDFYIYACQNNLFRTNIDKKIENIELKRAIDFVKELRKPSKKETTVSFCSADRKRRKSFSIFSFKKT